MQSRMQARAKINLHLHITGRAENGYHLLDSLVAFTSLYDDVQITPSNQFKLSITGNDALAASCTEQDNLISRVTHLLAKHIDIAPHVHIELTKNIPLAGGLGGGSADAAATLLILKNLWNVTAHDVLETIAASLGSDIVACLHNQPIIMRGTGNSIISAPKMPQLYGLLINPNIECSTPAVYKAYAQSTHHFSQNISFPDQFDSAVSLCEFLNTHTRNDLTDAAIQVAPAIKTVLSELQNLPHVLLSRLSGSGATCFALFANEADAQSSCLEMQKSHPEWWVNAINVNIT